MLAFNIFLLLIAFSYAVDTNLWDFVFDDVAYLTLTNKTTWRLQASGSTPGGFSMSEWNKATQVWYTVSGACTTLSLGEAYLYCTNSGHELFNRINVANSPGYDWNSWGIYGYDIKANINGNVWYVSVTPAPNGYTIYKYDPQSGISTPIPSTGAYKIAPSPDGTAWLMDSLGNIQKYDGFSWINMPGKAFDIIVGIDGVPLILTQDYTAEGWTVQRWSPTSNSWIDLPGIGGIALAIDGYNTPYIVTVSNQVYRLKGHISDICPSITITYTIF